MAAGVGACPVPESTKLLRREGVVFRSISDSFPTVEVISVWPDNRKIPVLESFLNVMDTYYKEVDGTSS